MKIYIDSDFKCYTASADGLTAVETDFFDGKCPEFVEGYRFVPDGQTWTRPDGAEFRGEMVAPWEPLEKLDRLQMAYEQERYDNLIAELSEVYENADSE